MKIQKNIKLSKYTTFSIGGVAKYFVEVSTKEELKEAYLFANENKLKVFVLGGGSNILVSDNEFEGLVIKLVNNYIKLKGNLVTSGAGVSWDNLVKFSIDNAFSGIECLSGIPGSVGGAIVGNIGAYGQEVKDTFDKLLAFDTKTLEFREFKKEDCEFEYRESFFKKKENKSKFVIYEIEFFLIKNANPSVTYESLKNYLSDLKITNPTLKEVREAVLTLREINHIKPDIAGNAGSFFKNPIVDKSKLDQLLNDFFDIKYFDYKGGYKIAAGWLIEKAGWKGKKMGNVSVSPKHALVIINPGKEASALEVEGLAKQIQDDVYNKFGIKIEKEVEFVNF